MWRATIEGNNGPFWWCYKMSKGYHIFKTLYLHRPVYHLEFSKRFIVIHCKLMKNSHSKLHRAYKEMATKASSVGPSNAFLWKTGLLRSHIFMSMLRILMKLCIFTWLGIVNQAVRFTFYFNEKKKSGKSVTLSKF